MKTLSVVLNQKNLEDLKIIKTHLEQKTGIDNLNQSDLVRTAIKSYANLIKQKN